MKIQSTGATRAVVESLEPAEDSGKPPLLFVHGLRHAAWCWQEDWMPVLAERGWPVHAINLRGHGPSATPDRPALVRDYVHDVMQAIIRLPRRPLLVGHSMGGYVVQRVLERYRAQAAVLVAPVPGHSGIGLALNAARRNRRALAAVTLGRPLPFTAEDLFSPELDRAEAASYLDRLDGASRFVQWELVAPRRAPRIETRMLVLGSPDDAVIPARQVARTARLLGTEPVWFPGMGHDLMLDARRREPLEAMAGWLEQVAAPRPVESLG